MIKHLLLALLLITSVILPQKKSTYDVQESKLSKSADANNSLSVTNDKLESTMLPAGYFTIGTSKGASQLKTDDNCQITYGHPFALTSHPLIEVDGTWYKADELFSAWEMSTAESADTLRLTGHKDRLSYEFMIINEASGKIRFVQKITNTDDVPHDLSTGLVIDPALGKWGDGSLYISDKLITRDTSLIVSGSKLTLWEKRTGAKGIGIEISSGNQFKLVAANWRTVYKNNSPELNSDQKQIIYDLLTKIYFTAAQVNAKSERTDIAELQLLAPDFSSEIFTRWDIPDYLDMSEGLMFPREFDTYAELSAEKSAAVYCIIKPSFTSNIQSTAQEYPCLVTDQGKFQHIRLTSDISYEDKVIDAVLNVMINGVPADEIHRWIFIPATPVSDSGLTVKIDSVRKAFPKIEFVFSVKNNSTGSLISNITKENIFLYENSSRINNYSFGKDTSSGVNAADIIFALDVTGSMGGIIDQVKNNILEFADSLNKRGIDYRLGLVTFLDEVENRYDFTKNVTQFKTWVSQQYAHGGGDGPENSLEALKAASQYIYRPNCEKVVIWITDIDYHESDWATQLTKNQVIDMLLMNDITVNAIGNESYQSTAYDPIIIPTNGKFYNISGNFRDILLDIARFRSSGKFVISYNSTSDVESNTVRLDIRVAGLGGSTEFQYSGNGSDKNGRPHLAFYPNPFNPEITFIVNNTNYTSGTVSIFNILGESVKSFSLQDPGISRLTWNARNDNGLPVTTGFYIVQLLLRNEKDEVYKETAKILYMK